MNGDYSRRRLIITFVSVIICLGFVFVALFLHSPMFKYNNAIKLLNAGEYDEAIEVFEKLDDFKDSKAHLNRAKLLSIKNTDIGEIVEFGSYERNGDTTDGPETLKWIVLDKKSDKVLIISRDALECLPYNSTNTNVTWETCTLRAWLNDSFKAVAFTPTEQELIVLSAIHNSDNIVSGAIGGSATHDYIFLLSIDEAEYYFLDDSSRRVHPTLYLKDRNSTGQGPYIDSNNCCQWWLRSPGRDNGDAACVGEKGNIGLGGYDVTQPLLVVRPCLWIDTSTIG